VKVVIADTLASSIQKLDAQSQALVKQAVFDFQVDPKKPSFQYHRLENAKDKNFWSIRVNQDLRIIIHRNKDTNVLCYADHHDPAYRWAERRRLEVHPETGAAQMVVIDERVEEVIQRVVKVVEEEPPVFAKYDPGYLAALGVPAEFLDAAKHVTQTNLFELLEVLPAEASERLFDLAAGRVVARPVAVDVGPFEHPDAQRRFAIVGTSEELRLALEAGWERWTVFLHPAQRAPIDKRFKGPAKVSGSAGTGKTVVALHRTAHLARQGQGRVLLTTFSSTLASRLDQHLDLLLPKSDAEREHVTIAHLHKLARDLWVKHHRRTLRVADRKTLDAHLQRAQRSSGDFGFDLDFLRAELEHVIIPHDVRTWDDYRAVSRAGRGVALGAMQRKKLWPVFERARASLAASGQLTWDQACHEVAALLKKHPEERFAHVVADEVQDFGFADLVLLRALAEPGVDDLFLCGDPGQRIFKLRTSWAAAGVDVRGRSSRLRVNYRTTEQIRSFASKLRDGTLEDDDGETLDENTVSLLSGLEPEVRGFASAEGEIEGVAAWLRPLLETGEYQPRDIAVFGRIDKVLQKRAEPALQACGLQPTQLRDDQPLGDGFAAVGTMHRAKGLEFKVVVVMGCEPGLVPLALATKDLTDPTDIAAVREQEKNLLYVAMTRARERLLVTWAKKPSEFLGSGED
jgi:mRNA-degrading endonuclease RelE of RelBE toxin-antitoxin system